MNFGDVAIVILTLALLFGAGFIVYFQLNSQSIEYREFVANATFNLPNKSIQFYPNMRFVSSTIPYSISEDCDFSRRQSILDALSIIQQKTIVRFAESPDNGIRFICSSESSAPDYDAYGRHVVAGSAKPEDILNVSRFYIIQKAKINLIRQERCDTPQVAIHEILHALGFDHSSSKESIMFPVTECGQIFDASIIEEINRIYSIPENPDLVIERFQANKTGNYLNLVIDIANYGLGDASNVKLVILSGQRIIKEYTFQNIGVGKMSQLTIENLRSSSDGSIVVKLQMRENDLYPEDNSATIDPIFQ